MKTNLNQKLSHTKIESLISKTLKHLDKLGYSQKTQQNYKYTWNVFYRFVLVHKDENILFTDLIDDFLKSKGILAENLNYYQKNIVTVMRILTDFFLHGCIQRRSRITKETIIPPKLYQPLIDYEKFCKNHLNKSQETLRKYKRNITQFLHYLDSHNINSVEQIQNSLISDFIISLIHLKPPTIQNTISALRSFLRYLCMNGSILEDMIQFPKVNVKKDQKIPTIWKNKEIDLLLAAIDRASPVGKRDYVIILLAIRLGMRVSDIRHLCFENILWDQERIEINLVKSGTPLVLPLTIEIGNALIEYIKNGRPSVSSYRNIFLRANAPFIPFSDNNNLYNIITLYRRKAGISLPVQSLKGMHSLRHTAASRLLETGTGLEVISDILGHVSKETTRIYTKIDIEALREAALNPEEVSSEY